MGGRLARWVCGEEPLGSQVDRQWRWDAFVSRNYLHDYMGPARFGLFGAPAPYDDDPCRRAVQMGARIVVRWNRMRNACTRHEMPRTDVVRLFGE